MATEYAQRNKTLLEEITQLNKTFGTLERAFKLKEEDMRVLLERTGQLEAENSVLRKELQFMESDNRKLSKAGKQMRL
jgi:hypothetical protein